jgi:4-hydroxy-3-polyprenylbenzoate decarboxylase
MRLIIGISGASGMPYALTLLEELAVHGEHEVIAVTSPWARKILQYECGKTIDGIRSLAASWLNSHDLAAAPASSSYPMDAMIVIPASVKTCSEIAYGHAQSLISRAADNMLKTRRPLIVCPRETPLSLPALKVLAELGAAGAVVLPLCPGFYHRPSRISELCDFIVGKILDILGIESPRIPRYSGDLSEET